MIAAYIVFDPLNRNSTLYAMTELMDHAKDFEAEWGGPAECFYSIRTHYDILRKKWIGRMDAVLAEVIYATLP